MENIKAEMGDDSIFNDPEVFVRYWDRLADKVQLDIARIESRLKPGLMTKLKARRGERELSARNPREHIGGDDSNRSKEKWFGGMDITDKETEFPRSPQDPLGLGYPMSEYSMAQLEEANAE
jgi:hypothetical protein